MKLVVTRKPLITDTTYGESVETLVDYLDSNKIEEDTSGSIPLYKVYVPTKPNPEVPIQYSQNDYIISILGG